MTAPAQVWVDYNDADRRGIVETLLTPGAIAAIGDRLRTGDFEGNRCDGTVVAIVGDGIVALQLNLDTFVEAPHPAPADR